MDNFKSKVKASLHVNRAFGLIDKFTSQNISQLLSKPPIKRTKEEIKYFLPSLVTRATCLKNIDKEVAAEVLRFSTLTKCKADDVIFTQGDTGDMFYIIISGQVSVYVREESKKKSIIIKLPEISYSSQSRGESPMQQSHNDEDHPTIPEAPQDWRTSQFGQRVNVLGSGYSFGELALLYENDRRNATIIADAPTSLLVISRNLFNNTIKDQQSSELYSKKSFIQSHPFFVNWSDTNKEQLLAVLKKSTYYNGQCALRQGSEVKGIHFLKSGRARLSVDLDGHRKQFPELFEDPNKDSCDAKGELKQKRSCLCDVKGAHMSDLTYIKRTGGYAAAEKMKSDKRIEVCSVQAGEVFNDLELLLGLKTQIFRVFCIKPCDMYTLDMDQFERLILRKNPQVLALMRTRAETKLIGRMATSPGKKVDLFPVLCVQLQYIKIECNKNSDEPAVVKRLPLEKVHEIVSKLNKKEELTNAIIFDREDEQKSKVSLPKSVTHGPEYFKKLMRKRCKERENIRKQYHGVVQQCSTISKEMKDMIVNNVKQQIYMENMIKKYSLSWNNEYTWLTRWK